MFINLSIKHFINAIEEKYIYLGNSDIMSKDIRARLSDSHVGSYILSVIKLHSLLKKCNSTLRMLETARSNNYSSIIICAKKSKILDPEYINGQYCNFTYNISLHKTQP